MTAEVHGCHVLPRAHAHSRLLVSGYGLCGEAGVWEGVAKG